MKRRTDLLALSLIAAASHPLAAAAAEEMPEAEPALVGDPAAPQALGRVITAGPTARSLFVVSSGGYGYTEAVLGHGDAHHRAAGSLSVEGRPLPWLSLALRLDGRYDVHVAPATPRDDGLVGDPRFYVRVDHALAPTLRAGVRAGLWLPGGAAPSLDFSAASPELSAALTYASAAAPLWLTANAGYRLDRSARSATDAAMLSSGDRLALEVSAFNEALLGVAAAYGRGRAQGFLEASADLLVGANHPSLSVSPFRVGGGARFALGRQLRLEAEAEVAPGARPDIMPGAPLVPVPPRLAVWLGLAYRFEATPAAAPLPPPQTEIVAQRKAAAPPVIAVVEGHAVADDGTAVPELHVSVGGEGQSLPVAVDADGRFTVSGPVGRALVVRAEAAGYDAATDTVTPQSPEGAALTLTLHRRLPSGQIRGLIRSLGGRTIEAEIRIEPLGRDMRAEQGRFELDVAPGTYQVRIAAPGYETQERKVQVEQNGVTLLNVDLRGER